MINRYRTAASAAGMLCFAVLASAATAQGSPANKEAGHDVWQSEKLAVVNGKTSVIAPPTRAWVTDEPLSGELASCDRAMMRARMTKPVDCMGMPRG